MLSVIVNRLAQTMLMYVLSKCVCDASLVTVPKSSVAVIGDRVELKCSSNSDKQVTWAFAPTNTATDAEFYFGDNISLPFRLRYTIDNSVTGQHDLIINSVDLEHAGKYSCFEFATHNNAIAYLTVLGASPECSVNTSSVDEGIMENDYLWMSCCIVYTGDMIPILSWTTNKADNTIASDTSTADNRKLPMTTNSSIIRQLGSGDNGVTFKCNIRFRLSSNSEGNPPEYEYTWNYTIRVLYGPRNLSIVRDEDRLSCSADGYPTPTYKWTHGGTNTFTDGPVLKLDGLYEKESTFQCIASNTLTSETKNITIQGSDTSRRTIVAVAVGGWSLLLFLIIVIVSYFVKGKILKVRGFGRGDSQVRASSIQVFQSARTLHLTTEELNSPMASDTENEDSQTPSTNAGYSALTHRPMKVQESQSYCQLRLDDQSSAIFTNQPSTERKQKNNDPVYCEIIEP